MNLESTVAGWLLEEWSLADFNGDTEAKESIQARRSEIDSAIEQHEQELSTLRISLADLGVMSREVAELAVKLDAIAFGNGYGFGSELRTALMKNESALNSRRKDARNSLPFVHPDTIEAVKEEDDPEYLVHKQAEQDRLEAARQARARTEKEAKEKVNTQYIGAGQGGSRRAATVGEATRKISETRGQ